MPIDPRYRAGFTAPTAMETPSDSKSKDSRKYGEAIYGDSGTLPGLDYFVGQEVAIKQIRLALQSAKAREARMPHTLLASGLAGIGKTTLAQHIAYEMGVGFVECSGRIGPEDAQRLLTGMEDGDILFIDEVHTLGKGNSSAWILPLMQDQVILTPGGPIEVADITIVAATTDAGKLSEALLSRFALKPRLQHYKIDEAAAIVELFAVAMDFEVNYSQALAIAEAANCNPRVIKNLCTVARDLFTVYGSIDLDEMFELTGVTPDGLDDDKKGYLLALSGCTNMTGSVNTLCAILGETGNIGHIEKDLIARGFVEVQPRGRRLTAAGMQRVKALV